MRTNAPRRVVATAILLLGGAGGCGSSPDPERSSGPQVDSEGVPADLVAADLPFVRYTLRPEEAALRLRVEVNARNECLESGGWPKYRDELAQPTAWYTSRDIYVLPIDVAERRGPLPPELPQVHVGPADAQPFSELSDDERWYAAWMDCAQQVAGELSGAGGTSDTFDMLLVELSDRFAASARLAERDPEMLELWVDWSACMAHVGYSYRSPVELAADPAQTAESVEELTDAVRDTAIANARCQAQIDYEERATAVYARYQRDAIDADESFFAQIEQRRATLAERVSSQGGEAGTG